LTRDILAFANTNGGHIVVGVRDATFEAVGVTGEFAIDTTRVHNAIAKYTGARLSLIAGDHDIEDPAWSGRRRFGLIYIQPYAGIAAVPSCDVSFVDDRGKTVPIFQRGEFLVRSGAQSCRADQVALDRLFRRYDAASAPPAEERPRILGDNLPPDAEIAVDFVGRQRELVLLWEWLQNPEQRRWLLTGDGGKGKSAIAYQFAKSVKLAAPKEFDYVFWFSAKQRKLVAGVVKPIERPDFTDLVSLLDAIAIAYGFSEYLPLPPSEKRERVKELLQKLPALIIADDIDSLEPEDQDAVEFLTYGAAQGSKVLFTSRSIPAWLYTSASRVHGLDDEDAQDFFRSRLKLFVLKGERFNAAKVRAILEVTERSPLYVEDLLRLCKFLPIDEAVAAWRGKEGEVARRYAVGKEFDVLTPAGKTVVLACCLNPGPMSYPEIKAVTGLTDHQLAAEMEAIQGLFLLSEPREVDGVERFDVNANTRALVMEIFGESDDARRIRDGLAKLTGDTASANRMRSEISAAVRQAAAFERLGRYEEARSVIDKYLLRYPNHPDLLGQMGALYSQWEPPKVNEARQNFQLAARGRCIRLFVYVTWVRMEAADKAWTGVIEAADVGLKLAGQSIELAAQRSIARSRRGAELRAGLHPERAGDDLALADRELRDVLSGTAGLRDSAERYWNSRVMQQLVRNDEARDDPTQAWSDLDHWRRLRPDDAFQRIEEQRLQTRSPRRAGRLTIS
jgi:hypothetical protein